MTIPTHCHVSLHYSCNRSRFNPNLASAPTIQVNSINYLFFTSVHFPSDIKGHIRLTACQKSLVALFCIFNQLVTEQYLCASISVSYFYSCLLLTVNERVAPLDMHAFWDVKKNYVGVCVATTRVWKLKTVNIPKQTGTIVEVTVKSTCRHLYSGWPNTVWKKQNRRELNTLLN
jgi:hypothetical protein